MWRASADGGRKIGRMNFERRRRFVAAGETGEKFQLARPVAHPPAFGPRWRGAFARGKIGQVGREVWRVLSEHPATLVAAHAGPNYKWVLVWVMSYPINQSVHYAMPYFVCLVHPFQSTLSP